MVAEPAKALPLATATSANESALDASLTLGPTNTAEGEALTKKLIFLMSHSQIYKSLLTPTS